MPELCWPDNFINRKANKIVKRFINLIIKKFNLKKIIIFGSFARGDYHKGSDLVARFIITHKILGSS